MKMKLNPAVRQYIHRLEKSAVALKEPIAALFSFMSDSWSFWLAIDRRLDCMQQ